MLSGTQLSGPDRVQDCAPRQAHIRL